MPPVPPEDEGASAENEAEGAQNEVEGAENESDGRSGQEGEGDGNGGEHSKPKPMPVASTWTRADAPVLNVRIRRQGVTDIGRYTLFLVRLFFGFSFHLPEMSRLPDRSCRPKVSKVCRARYFVPAERLLVRGLRSQEHGHKRALPLHHPSALCGRVSGVRHGTQPYDYW